jgi:hypothetical protein
MFRVKIETGNAAFEGDSKGYEIARILRDAADRIEDGQKTGYLYDVNGNRVGEFRDGR